MDKEARGFRYITSPSWWTGELVLMLVAGFVLATLLWVGLWFLHLKPDQALVLQEQMAAVERCLAEKESWHQEEQRLKAENREISRRLNQARAGWARCIRSKSAPEE